ncbi:VWA domain-containing protein [Lentisphaera marina]|uniref:VWA domain-containing protein n=1 Tax=Lentisphaera marina TaxID=1111041 RepID=UPI0023651F48|nr:VWA domain-containing protein [Lentisphaera marina]MDD7985699.1 VWA domain-containing protein [Lentisphaera marina]
MSFQYPWLLLLLIVLIPLFWRQLRLKPPAVKVSSLPHFTGKHGSEHRPFSRFLIPIFFEFLALTLMIIAFARPRTGEENSYSYKDGVDIVFSLDISGSMSSYDQPDNIPKDRRAVAEAINNNELHPRLHYAKKAISDFIDKRKSDRLGLVVFGAEAYSVCPPTNDHEYLQARLKEISTEYLGDYNRQTNITAAISGGLARLRKSAAPKKIIILVTDGSHTASTDLTPRMAAKAAEKSDAIIYTIGVGNELAWTVENFFGSSRLNASNSDFDEELLKEIAKKTGGLYFSVRQADQMEEVLKKIDALEKVELKHFHNIKYAEHFAPFIWASLVCLVIATFLSHSLFMRYP